jgi:hypothetical protein
MVERHWAPMVLEISNLLHSCLVTITLASSFWRLCLIARIMMCCKFGSQMSWCVDASVKVVYRWRCLRATFASACRASTSTRKGTIFWQSNLNFMHAVLLTYDIVRRVLAHTIQQEHQFGSATITDWAKLCREVMLECPGLLSENRRS